LGIPRHVGVGHLLLVRFYRSRKLVDQFGPKVCSLDLEYLNNGASLVGFFIDSSRFLDVDDVKSNIKRGHKTLKATQHCV
jgi:hypothetical protein